MQQTLMEPGQEPFNVEDRVVVTEGYFKGNAGTVKGYSPWHSNSEFWAIYLWLESGAPALIPHTFLTLSPYQNEPLEVVKSV